MRREKLHALLAILFFAGLAGCGDSSSDTPTTPSAPAVVVNVSEWTVVGDVDTGVVQFRVTERFTSAAELGGDVNRYEYSVENLTVDLVARLFRISNPGGLTRTMSSPAGWGERVGVPNFLWETSDASVMIDPGETLGGFVIETPGLIPASGNPYTGWIRANRGGERVDVFGNLTR